MSWSPFKFRDLSGVVTLDGEAEGAGGFGTYNGGQAGIIGGGSGAFAWQKGAGDDLLDLTNPHAPAVLADGVYAFSAEVFGFADADGNLYVTLTGDGGGVFTPTLSAVTPLSDATGGSASMTLIVKTTAGTSCALFFQNVGPDTIEIAMNVYVAKLA